MVLLLLLGPQGIPPLAQDLTDGPVVLVGVTLVDQGPVPLAEDHEGIHRPPDMVLLPLQHTQARVGHLGLGRQACGHRVSWGQVGMRHLVGAASILL